MEAKHKLDSQLQIVLYNPEYHHSFKSLNIAWIQKYFKVEAIDEKVLSFPDEYIYKNGGLILMALIENKAVGTVALMRINSTTFELTKMAVDEDFQGAGIGHQLAVAAIEKSKSLGAKELLLYSQTSLAPAIRLYRKLGFKEVPLEQGKYERCNIKMKISFEEQKIIHSLSKNLKEVVENAYINIKKLSVQEWHNKITPERWSRKEILGHLIDSASNNHQRFVRIQYVEDKNFPGYEQDQWVNIQNYQHLPINDLLNMWYFYNIHLCNIILQLHYDQLYTICTRGGSEPITFHDLIVDYKQHLQHHMRQILN